MKSACFGFPLFLSPAPCQLRLNSSSRCRTVHQVYLPTFHCCELSDHEPPQPPPTVSSDDVKRALSNVSRRVTSTQKLLRQLGKSEKTLTESGSGPDDLLLGGDVTISESDSESSSSASTVVQDLPIPNAPTFFDVALTDAIALLLQTLFNRGASDAVLARIYSGLTRISQSVRADADSLQARALKVWGKSTSSSSSSSRVMEEEFVGISPIDAVVHLLLDARFVVLPRLPEVDDPPPLDAVQLGCAFDEETDPTILVHSDAMRSIIEGRERDSQREGENKGDEIDLGEPSVYPYFLVARRGTSVVRSSGLLLGSKLKAAERFVVSVIAAPVAGILRAVLQRGSKIEKKMEEGKDRESGKFVRRVVPRVTSKKALFDMLSKEQLKPSVTQEPCHSLLFLLHQPTGRSGRMQKRRWREDAARKASAFVGWVSELFKREEDEDFKVKNLGRRRLDDFQSPLMSEGQHQQRNQSRPCMQMFRNVPWGTVRHVFPATYVMLNIRDLLRIDAVTVGALGAAFVSAFAAVSKSEDDIIHRNVATLSLIFSIATYAGKLFLAWQRTLSSYELRIAQQKMDAVMCQGECTVGYLAALAAQEEFADAACVWLAGRQEIEGLGFENAFQIQREAFAKCRLSEGDIVKWMRWLDEEEQDNNQVADRGQVS